MNKEEQNIRKSLQICTAALNDLEEKIKKLEPMNEQNRQQLEKYKQEKANYQTKISRLEEKIATIAHRRCECERKIMEIRRLSAPDQSGSERPGRFF